MKYSNLFWGVVLILLGILFILKNLGVFFFNWSMILKLWPLFLVLWGIAVLPVKNVFKIVFSLLAILATVLIISFSPYEYSWNNWHFDDDRGNRWEFRFGDDHKEKYKNEKDDEKAYTDEESKRQDFSEPWENEIEIANINVEAAIGDFSLLETTDDLISFTKEGNLGPYKIISRLRDNRKYIDLDLKKKVFKGSGFKNSTELKLNTNPIWDIEVGAGAADINMDLRPFKVKKLELDGGASAVKLVLGDRYNDVKLNIEAAASSIEIKVPEDAGCYIDLETFLSSKSFEGFQKTEDGNYQTENYKTADIKIIINLNTAVADFSIKRY